MMKILLISGHGHGDSGAVGCGYKEADLTIKMVNKIAPKLRKYATVDVYDTKRNAYEDVTNGTFKIGKYDYALEVHFNASNGQGHGTEIFVTSAEKGTTVEQKIMKNMGKFFTVRGTNGVKVTDFLVIKTIKNKGISSALIETCFIDNKSDMAIWKKNTDAIVDAIVNGIVDGFKLKKTNTSTTTKTTSTSTKKATTTKKSITTIAKEVIAGKWGNGAARKTALTKAGYDYAKVQAKVNELLK